MNLSLTDAEARVLVARIYAADESMDARAFVSMLSPDAVFQLGAAPAITGRESIQHFVQELFSSLKELSHRLVDVWVGNGKLVFQGEATFTFRNGRRLMLAYVDVLTPGAEGLFADYRIHIDLTPMDLGTRMP